MKVLVGLSFVAFPLVLSADARILGFASTGPFVGRLQQNHQEQRHQHDIGLLSDQKTTGVLTRTHTASLGVATIDAGELWDGSYYHLRDSRLIEDAEAAATTLIKKSNLPWSIIALTLSILAVASTGALGSLTKLSSAFISWYLSVLDAAPLLTKCVTGGLIAFAGDYGAQWFEWKSKQTSKESDNTKADLSKDSTTKQGNTSIHKTYNIRRGMARFLECLLISSPLMHYGYDLFETLVPTIGGGSALYRSFAALTHVMADCILLDAVFVMTGIVCTNLLEGQRFRKQVIPNLRRVYWPTLKASIMTCGLLAPFQFLSFRFLPLSLRVLSVNAVDLIWNGVISFVSHGE